MEDKKKRSFAQVAKSVAAALFGVQSDKQRGEDFGQSSPWPFIIGGVAAIALFVGVLISLALYLA